MSSRELVVLGTASQVPTRHRNQNGYFLRWDGEGVLFDPGEGTQRQLLLAGVASSSITRICLTHLHGDHCLGLPGVVQRMSLDGVSHPVDIYFPAGGRPYVDHLLTASVSRMEADLRLHEVSSSGLVAFGPSFSLLAEPLDHLVETYGWRLQEPDGRRMLPDRLDALGVHGPDVGRLQREGTVDVDGRTVTIDEASEPRRGQSMAFVMDTRMCAGAAALAAGVDLLVCESTFLDRDAGLAQDYGHLTALQAAELAAEAGAQSLVLTHFSSRYPDEEELAAEARPVFAGVVAARDLDRIPVPPRT
jgi:ribonuclease Z